MELSDKITAVSRMQEFINAHIHEEITLDELCSAAGYSKYYAVRVFKELTGKTPFETIRALRLTKAAQVLRDTDAKVIDAAFTSGFESHDGFTRAFTRRFFITPRKYQCEKQPVPYFIHYPIKAYYILKEGLEAIQNEKVSKTVNVSVVERGARKLIFLRIPTAKDYFAACEEVGCDWEGYYNSIPEKLDYAAGGPLPKNLIKPGTGGYGFFVEVPVGYGKPLPDGYEVAELPPCTYLYFTGMPYDNPDDFYIAIGILNEAIENYPFERFGWEKTDDAPYLGMGAEAETGARTAVPVRKI